jgi:endonuclease/exonuclease/phosphatase family metal-dependent hydrolase
VTHIIRVATYNVHKCRGLDRKVNPSRIADVIAELECNIVALQEVLSLEDDTPEHDQARFLAEKLGYRFRFGENRRLGDGAYGNVTLSRLPFTFCRNYDLSWRGRERRGCLRCDVAVGATRLHVFNVHLGTSFFERRHQGRKLLNAGILTATDLLGPRVVVGDFNEWTRGLASRLMAGQFRSIDARLLARFGRTYPGILPLLHLDHFYHDEHLSLEYYKLHRSRLALAASDHLPIVAEFSLEA